MIKQIRLELNSKVGPLVDNEPFFLTDGERLNIEFVGNVNSVLVVTVKNGDIKRQVLVHNGRFAVDKDLLVEGTLEMIVTQYNSTSIAAKWVCEPVEIIKPREDVFEGYPQITMLKEKIADLQAEIHVLQETVVDLQQQVGRLWEIEES